MAQSADRRWKFDLCALMVLIGEAIEERNRHAGRSLSASVVAAPVVGIQSYLKSLDPRLETTSFNYLSPIGSKRAPLRNMRLDNIIRHRHLLKDGRYTTYRIRPRQERKVSWPSFIWLVFTWATFLTTLLIWKANTAPTWTGLSVYIALTAWSIFLRLVDHVTTYIPAAGTLQTEQPQSWDAAVIIGTGHSALVLEGSRGDVKHWTACGLVRKERALGLPVSIWQYAARFGTLLVLVSIVVAIPNATPTDQLFFIASNILGQINALLTSWSNVKADLECLERVDDLSGTVRTRTDMYARVLRQFRHLENQDWPEKAGMLPDTVSWKAWRSQVVISPGLYCDPKMLYSNISQRKEER